MEQHTHAIKAVADGALGVGAITSPLWLQALEISSSVLMIFGGLILLGLRLAITWREWRRGA